MLTKKDINLLSIAINDSKNNNIRLADTKKRINSILHNKSNKSVIKELGGFIANVKGNEKNKVVLIVIMSLLRRNLDCQAELSELIKKYKLEGCLYGGLKSFFSGDSEQFGLKIKLNTDSFENKYEYITRFTNFEYWKLIDLFESAKILSLVAFAKFEQLAYEDKSSLILLNMVIRHLNIAPSDELISKLLQSDDELKQNIGFLFVTDNVSKAVNDICEIKRCKKQGLFTNKKPKAATMFFKTEINRCCVFLEICSAKTRAALLLNYLLLHQSEYPTAFSKMLMSSFLQDELYKQIKETKKIRNLKDVCFLLSLIFHTPALDDKNKRISKAKLYDAVTDVLISFIEEDKGIYGWNEQQKNYVTEICKMLPKKNICKLNKHLQNKRKTLMTAKIDELVRFKIYLKDKQKQDIIDGILNIIQIYCNV